MFGGSIIDEALYESLEEALLMADTGVPANSAQDQMSDARVG